jgi:hypothetical protein
MYSDGSLMDDVMQLMLKAAEAIPSYLRAIELRPGYARGHLNLGISYSNLMDCTPPRRCPALGAHPSSHQQIPRLPGRI